MITKNELENAIESLDRLCDKIVDPIITSAFNKLLDMNKDAEWIVDMV